MMKLAVNTSFNYSYIQIKLNDRKEEIINILCAFVELLIKEINHPALLQEHKLNADAAECEINIDANLYKTSEKRKFNCVDSDT